MAVPTASTMGRPRKAKERTLESCLAEVRREWPNLPRSKRRAAAKLVLHLHELEVLRDKLGDEAFDALFQDFVNAQRVRLENAK